MSDKRFKAILAKNMLARDIATLVREDEVQVSQALFLLNRLIEIEAFIGEGNQPSVEIIYQNNKQRDRKYVI